MKLAPRIEHQDLLGLLRARLSRCLRGKPTVIDLALSAFFAGGHLLLEGPPGTGKTSLGKGMAQALGGTFRRIQMTSDLLPSDIVGILRLAPGEREFEFRRGPIFTNFLLADELNRTSPKTQSALLEAMAEHTVSIDGQTYELPDPFFVIATQNPMEFQGVYPLAESQLDRFMLQLTFDSPSRADELNIYRPPGPVVATAAETASESGSVIAWEELQELRHAVALVHCEESVLEYATDLVRATRGGKGVVHGVSVRGGLQLVSAARALAFIRGRTYVTPPDVSELAVPVMAHRLCFASGDADAAHRVQMIEEILQRVRPPR